MKQFFLAAALFIISSTGVYAADSSKTVTLYKTPQCGCCEGYADYLRDYGFEVTVVPTHDLVSISSEAGVDEEFQGCHTMFIDDYVVSGHVPIKTLNKLLMERPEIIGITMPGMPLGSPGMGGEKQDVFEILEVGSNGSIIYNTE